VILWVILESLEVKNIHVVITPLWIRRNSVHQSDSELTAFEEKSRGISYCGPNLDHIVMQFEQLSDGAACRLGGKVFQEGFPRSAAPLVPLAPS
jgi:hypothetical protein